MALNGRLPDSMLVYLGWPEVDHLRLRPDAAHWLNLLAAAFEAEFKKPLYLSDAYRTYATQVSLKITKGVFAATPGTSVHGLGLAIDVASRVNVDGSAEHRWMEANAPLYGWFNPFWAQDYNSNNGQHEPWHWEFAGAPNVVPSTPTKEEDMPLNAADATLINSVIVGVIRSKEFNDTIRDAVLTTVIDGGVGTVAQAVRDARIISRRTEIAVTGLPAAIIAALPPATDGMGFTLAQFEAAVKSALSTLQLKAV